MSNQVDIRKLMKKDSKGVQRQFMPETSVKAIFDIEEMIAGTAPVLSVNGKVGNVQITKEDLGISQEPETIDIASESNDGIITSALFLKLQQIISDYDSGLLGGSAITIEPVGEE
ncbi:hypothetical protein [Enterococcus phoeniculicola]|jgi:hypothetical protein|uniref:Uncharacterized protein n=1 Tax=Enterococcus phoeniculicola ATCC BAA-412 TaxID=1158610 RepID=R3W1T3_9ENTE|nr:hypothetical protein [Enterococcus phoeniculicola]EOL41617.1 hypothetical protein UC3_03181 [Enterococcus phoeniculicola ATCC BAA-412]EOT78889.1 hypothetical protein I589_00395 [Enterococcus phoeniculicola ATCC BAA-412]